MSQQLFRSVRRRTVLLQREIIAWQSTNSYLTTNYSLKHDHSNMYCLLWPLGGCTNTRDVLPSFDTAIRKPWCSSHRSKHTVAFLIIVFGLLWLFIWGALQQMVYRHKIKDIDHLKQVLYSCWDMRSQRLLLLVRSQSRIKYFLEHPARLYP